MFLSPSPTVEEVEENTDQKVIEEGSISQPCTTFRGASSLYVLNSYPGVVFERSAKFGVQIGAPCRLRRAARGKRGAASTSAAAAAAASRIGAMVAAAAIAAAADAASGFARVAAITTAAAVLIGQFAAVGADGRRGGGRGKGAVHSRVQGVAPSGVLRSDL